MTTIINTVTEVSIEADVKQIFIDAGWATAPHMSVRACESGGSSWRRGVPTGMFSIDVWGARETYGSSRGQQPRTHMFRTKKDGTFSAETLNKIKEFAVNRLAREVAQKAAEQVRTTAINDNTVTAAQLRDYAKVKTGSYYSSYTSQYGGYITEDSGVSGKVKVNVGNQILSADQAKQLFDLIASFK